MNKYLILTLLTITIIGCKRGENDPLISLKSRTSRLTGSWKLNSASISLIHNTNNEGSANASHNTESFDGNIWNQTQITTYNDQPAITETQSWSYSKEYIINKDGTYTYKIINDDEIHEGEGSWTWIDQGANKAGILIEGETYLIDQLKNNEMILTSNGESKFNEADGLSFETIYSESYSYIKQ